MLKRLLALLMTLCMVMSIAPAMATTTDTTTTDATATDETTEEESGPATNPYTFPEIEVTIALPGDLTVTNEQVTDEGVIVSLAKDGRTDTGYTLSLMYNEAYEGYTMSTLTDDMKQELINHYAGIYKSDNPPYFTEATEEEYNYRDLVPFVAFGTAEDGNLYMINICILDGFVLTAACGIAGTEFDVDSAGSIYNLYWQAVEMFMSSDEEGTESETETETAEAE